MFSRTRVLLVAITVALFAWMLGYGMGGGLRGGGKGVADSREEATAHGSGTSTKKTDTHTGTARPAEDTLAEQIAARRIPWTRERLLHSVSAMGQEPDIMHAVRLGMKLTEQLGPDDFPLAIEIAAEMKDQLDEEGEVFKMLALMRWAELKPEAVAEYLKANDKVGKGFIMSDSDMVLAVWGGSNPTAAIAWARTLREDQQTNAIQKIVEATARRDPDAAVALAQSHAPELLKEGVVADAIESALRKRDPERSARTIASLGDAKKISSAAQQWAQKDRDAAARWAQDLPDEKMRAEALKGVWQEFTAKHPEEAAAQLSKNSADAPFIADTGKDIARNLAEKDPQKAAQWAATLRQPEARKEAFSALGEYHAGKDGADAGQWLNTLPEGVDRESAIKGFVYRAKDNYPEEATEWATAIQDTDARRAALSTALGYWCRNDLPAALEWLQTSPSISDEDRRALLKKD